MIREAIQSIAGTMKKSFPAFLAKVKSVDEADNVCDIEPLNDDADMFDVRFRAQLGSASGFFAVPKIGSVVLVVQTSEASGVVVCYSDVEKISLVCDGEENGGLVKIDALFTRLRAIENMLTQLNTLLTTHTHPVASGVAGPSPMLATLPSPGSTVKSDLQNPKVKH